MQIVLRTHDMDMGDTDKLYVFVLREHGKVIHGPPAGSKGRAETPISCPTSLPDTGGPAPAGPGPACRRQPVAMAVGLLGNRNQPAVLAGEA